MAHHGLRQDPDEFQDSTACLAHALYRQGAICRGPQGPDYQTMKEYDRFEKERQTATRQRGCSKDNWRTGTKREARTNIKIIVTTIQKLDIFIRKTSSMMSIKACCPDLRRAPPFASGDMHQAIVKSLPLPYIRLYRNANICHKRRFLQAIRS